MEDILQQCFDFRCPPSDALVIEKLFSNIEVKSSDAAFSVRFSDVDIKYEVGRGVPLAWFWCDAIIEIVEYYYGEKKSNNSRDYARLSEFLKDGNSTIHFICNCDFEIT